MPLGSLIWRVHIASCRVEHAVGSCRYSGEAALAHPSRMPEPQWRIVSALEARSAPWDARTSAYPSFGQGLAC